MSPKFHFILIKSFVKKLEQIFIASTWTKSQKHRIHEKVEQVFTVTQQHPLTKAFGCSDEKLLGSRHVSQALKEILGNSLKLRKARFHVPGGGGSPTAFLRLIFVVNLPAQTIVWLKAFTHAAHGKHEKTIDPKVILELLIELKQQGTLGA